MLRSVLCVVAAILPAAFASLPVRAASVCTVIADPSTGQVILREGDCARQVTPASTFKIPLAVMGFDSGFLQSAILPELSWRKGEPDWGGKPWKEPATPKSWMKHSIVWYSQRITASLGTDKLTGYGQRFHYGNADFSGDLGKGNGLERSWIASSLKISPDEQVAFLSALLRGALPVKTEAMASAISLLDSSDAGGWIVSGKTGSAFPRKTDGRFDRNRGWGWFVGFAERGGRRLVFAHLTQDDGPVKGSAGLRARDAFLADWPALMTGR